MIRPLSIASLAILCAMALSAPAAAQFPMGNNPNPLFSQYVTQGAGVPSAAMYPAPHPSPLLGAQSYYTYQPLMPHEMMYQHSRNYYNYYNTGGYYGGDNALNKTQVRWQAGNLHMGPMPFSTPLAGLAYHCNARRYCLGNNCGGDCGGRRHFLRHHRGCAGGNCAGGTCATGAVVTGAAADDAAPVEPVAEEN